MENNITKAEKSFILFYLAPVNVSGFLSITNLNGNILKYVDNSDQTLILYSFKYPGIIMKSISCKIH